VCALLVAAGIPATAKPTEGKGKKPPQQYEVTMQVPEMGAEGLITVGCAPVIMEPNSTLGGLTAVEPVSVGLEAQIHWQRTHPTPTGGTFLAGCHGSNEMWDGLFNISYDQGTESIRFLWHFDYVIEYETRELGNGKVRERRTLSEHFTMSSDPIPWAGPLVDPNAAVTGTAAGGFRVLWYLNEDGDLVHGYDWFYPNADDPDQPANPEGAIRPFEFTLTVTPIT
jgi:hypothetical protein